MKKQKIVYIALLVAMIISTGAFQGALAAGNQSPELTVTYSVLTIVNKTDQKIDVTLTPDNSDPARTVTVLQHSRDDVELKDGVTYTYDYQYCDLGNTDDAGHGEIKLDGDDSKLVLYPCTHQPTKFVINNHLAKDVSFELLYGYKEYALDIEKGKNRVEVFSGNYVYNYDACGVDFSGDVFVKKSGTTVLTLHSCEWFTDPARIYGPLNPAKYKLINHASFPIILTLIGPENYLVTVNPGLNRVKLVAGNYTYSYYLDYSVVTGSMYVPVNGTGGLTLKPEFVMNNGSGDDLE